MGLLDIIKDQAVAGMEKKEREKQELKERIEKMDAEGVVYCPKCYSTSIAPTKKGFGAGKAILGTLVAGPVGLVAGAIGKNKVELHCMKCGYKWKAGK